MRLKVIERYVKGKSKGIELKRKKWKIWERNKVEGRGREGKRRERMRREEKKMEGGKEEKRRERKGRVGKGV